MALATRMWDSVQQKTIENNKNPHGYSVLSYDQHNFWPYTHTTKKIIRMTELRQITSSVLFIASRLQSVHPKI